MPSQFVQEHVFDGDNAQAKACDVFVWLTIFAIHFTSGVESSTRDKCGEGSIHGDCMSLSLS